MVGLLANEKAAKKGEKLVDARVDKSDVLFGTQPVVVMVEKSVDLMVEKSVDLMADVMVTKRGVMMAV